MIFFIVAVVGFALGAFTRPGLEPCVCNKCGGELDAEDFYDEAITSELGERDEDRCQ